MGETALETASRRREALLEAAAIADARAWTKTSVLDLVREGRAIEGGWAGTMSEARIRARVVATRVLLELSLPALTHGELDRLARITFDEARRSWRAAA